MPVVALLQYPAWAYLVILVATVLLLYVLGRLVANLTKFACRLYLRFAGERGTGVILSTRGTGGKVSAFPVLRLEIQVNGPDGQPATRTFRRLCDSGNLPRAGDPIEIYRSKTNPGFFVPA